MAISTHAELKTAVANWLDRSNLTSRIPEFIRIAESQIGKDVRIRQMEKRVSASISTEYYDVPTDLIKIRNVQLTLSDRVIPLEYLTPEQMDHFLSSDNIGEPYYYTIIGEEFQFKLIPDQTYTIEIAYFARFPYFTGDNDTNWLLTNFPEIYLYATLVAAEPYVDNDKEVQKWMALYASSVKAANKQDQEARFSGATLRRRSKTIEDIPYYGA